ncbi:Chromosome partitioning ATPase, Mrp family, contains Fe-S cluster [Caminicella sporogenes DSM 14501]|uniref:Iron-sulfur cluster carrier protein n=1 Tax=Caminicella sporogenes DSM 14501 TaxID=1121266 RepID=A0A1M6P4Z0_9FIRM|nr:Mrp/NBP35 family ATP-binding protein [Caminicella sporogenes]WIF94195.1 Mrp/NBP35 family ATP-binding protein [Caminicella sporogenes]SHK03029.1 Chromosome partitioning ATPase, Mrp family, contains Fe-S cluster [Caminicella sporogenes DSM 14501]
MNFTKEKPNELSNIKKIVAVMSGKGGVGKSSVTSLLAISLRDKGYNVGILDADITGPSIPKIFGINGKRATGNDKGLNPVVTTSGIKVISLNLLVEQEDDPVVWRGPIISGTVKQFFTDVNWGDIDYLLIDLPPGTGDVPLTIMQSLPLDGIVIVSSPQDLVKLIVKKSVNMAKMMNVPILGIVENMSYFECPDCGKKINIFGKSKIEEVSKEMNIDVIAKLPIDQEFVELCDEGRIELYGKIKFDLMEKLSLKLTEKMEGDVK